MSRGRSFFPFFGSCKRLISHKIFFLICSFCRSSNDGKHLLLCHSRHVQYFKGHDAFDWNRPVTYGLFFGTGARWLWAESTHKVCVCLLSGIESGAILWECGCCWLWGHMDQSTNSGSESHGPPWHSMVSEWIMAAVFTRTILASLFRPLCTLPFEHSISLPNLKLYVHQLHCGLSGFSKVPAFYLTLWSILKIQKHVTGLPVFYSLVFESHCLLFFRHNLQALKMTVF